MRGIIPAVGIKRLHGAALTVGLGLALGLACGDANNSGSFEAGVGGEREGCGDPGSHSLELADHSCACDPGYAWCSEAIDDFNCCASDESDAGDTDPAASPDERCDADAAERLVCVIDPAAPDDPGATQIWACNGERWVSTPGYSAFACMAAGFPFAYGCAPGLNGAEFLCGFGSGSSCDSEQYASVCVKEDIIDSCVWGRRTVDRCARLCAELGVFGPGYVGGSCEQPDPELPAACACCTDC